jgi:redox-sensitive bicupin YhaK (pirin superfamily)
MLRSMRHTSAGLLEQVRGSLQVLPARGFHRLTEAEFGMPGLIAIESVGPFVQLASVGPFITIHDSFLEPGLGIGHHPHRGNERLFYILRGEIRHDDALNGITGVMGEGDLARLTEGERGMLHREWNGRDDLTTHAFILVYTPDVEPPIPLASFAAHRAGDMPRVTEADGVETLHVLGGDSGFRASHNGILSLFDSTIAAGSSLERRMGPNEGLILYPLEGTLRLDAQPDGEALLPSVSSVHPEGPDAVALLWSEADGRQLRVSAEDGPARLLRIGIARRGPDLAIHEPWAGRPAAGATSG